VGTAAAVAIAAATVSGGCSVDPVVIINYTTAIATQAYLTICCKLQW
jgi:hypothetical protein